MQRLTVWLVTQSNVWVRDLFDSHVHSVDATDLNAAFDCVTRDAFICVSSWLIWVTHMWCTALMLLICMQCLTAWLVMHLHVWVRGLFEWHTCDARRWCYWFVCNVSLRDSWRIHMCEFAAYLSYVDVMHGVDATSLYTASEFVTRDAFIRVSSWRIGVTHMWCTALMLLICMQCLTAWLVMHSYVWVCDLFEGCRCHARRWCYWFVNGIWVRDSWHIHTCEFVAYLSHTELLWLVHATVLHATSEFVTSDAFIRVTYSSDTDSICGVDAADLHATFEFVPFDAFTCVGS